MKKILILLLLLSILVHPTALFAATTPTPTPTTTPTGANSIENQIDNLKDRIASRVAQLNLVEKRGIMGTVTDVSETQITVLDLSNNKRLIDVDELTKFSSPSAKSSFGISDITKGEMIGAIGLYNKESRRILARFVDVVTEPQVLSGAIVSINKDAYTFTIATVNSDEITIDVEDITKTLIYTKDAGAVRAGFSKLQVNERVLISGYYDTKNSNMIIASRILAFPDIPANPRIPLVKQSDIAPITPSTGSGKKLTPLTR